MKKYNPENQPKAWFFLLPSLGVILLFNIYPLLRSFWMSFQKGSLLKLQYTGLDNYKKVISDPVFHKALMNTALYAFAVVPVALLISVVVAWIIFEKILYLIAYFFSSYIFSDKSIYIAIIFNNMK